MDCPHCQSKKTKACILKTVLGYPQYRCRNCSKQFNERTSTKLNYIEYSTEVVMMAVFFYYRFKVSLDDGLELMMTRGFHLSHQTIHNWAHTFGVDLGLKLRQRRQGKAGKKWHVDAPYLRIEGRWFYPYRAIDFDANLVDVYLSDVRFRRQQKNSLSKQPRQQVWDPRFSWKLC
jgi:putative transposase